MFSAQDAAHFTNATDGERKRLLEQLLGLDKFDVALTKCRLELKEVETNIGSLSTQFSILNNTISEKQSELNRLKIEFTKYASIQDVSFCETSITSLRSERNELNNLNFNLEQ